jgi:hypothetical protein
MANQPENLSLTDRVARTPRAEQARVLVDAILNAPDWRAFVEAVRVLYEDYQNVLNQMSVRAKRVVFDAYYTNSFVVPTVNPQGLDDFNTEAMNQLKTRLRRAIDENNGRVEGGRRKKTRRRRRRNTRKSSPKTDL